MAEDKFADEELGQPLLAAVDAIRSEPVCEEVLDRVTSQVRKLSLQEEKVRSGSDYTGVGPSRRFGWATFAVASMVVLGTVLAFSLSKSSAWAQVVSAVAENRWMRLRLQKPEAELPDGEVFKDVTMWFSGDFKTAALKHSPNVSWIDIEEGDEYRYQPQSDRVIIAKLDLINNASIQQLLAALAPFDGIQRTGGTRPVVSETELTVNGKSLQEFQFTFPAVGDAQPASTVTVRVDKATKRPVRIQLRRAVFAIDFPDFGPTDIHAMGVAKGTPVDDLRELDQYFPERSLVGHANYEAIEVTVLAGWEGKRLNEAHRYRSTGGEIKCEQADLHEIRELSQSVYYADGDKPTGAVHDMDWWAREANKLEFTEFNFGESNFPHRRCNGSYGSVRDYDSAHVSNLEGLEGMIELRGSARSVWLDPKRDLIVRRREYALDDGTISVRQYDEVIQDKNGVWFVKKWRNGNVSERGGDLPVGKNDQTGVATTVHYAKIMFR